MDKINYLEKLDISIKIRLLKFDCCSKDDVVEKFLNSKVYHKVNETYTAFKIIFQRLYKLISVNALPTISIVIEADVTKLYAFELLF